MERIDDRTVELTDQEIAAYDRFHTLLDRGHGIPLAAKVAMNQHRILNREFIAWLSEDTCYLWGDRVLVRPDWRNT